MSDNQIGGSAPQGPVLNSPIGDGHGMGLVWEAARLSDEDWRLTLEADCLAELDEVARRLRANPLLTVMLTPEAFALAACQKLMAEARRILDRGAGFVLIDRLPLERYSAEEATDLYWLLGSCLTPPVAQKWDGTMIYPVRDSGKAYGDGVRNSITNRPINFHTDNSFSTLPPDYVGLLCLNQARSGGGSKVSSIFSAHNDLLKHAPRLLERLYQPFWFDRQREHHPDEAPVNFHPVFFHGASLRMQFSEGLIRKGYDKAGKTLDATGDEAIRALTESLGRPEAVLAFEIAPGQIQIVNNRIVAHRREGFEDYPEPERMRHLVRLWFRESGDRTFCGLAG